MSTSNDALATEERIKRTYGHAAMHDRVEGKGGEIFTIVHLDSPDQATRQSRIANFDPDSWFSHDCPACRDARSSGIVVFDESLKPTDITDEDF